MSREGALPASGMPVRLRDPTGEDELVVLQSDGPPAFTMLELASRLGRGLTGESIDWLGLPAVDLDAAALLIRGSWLGDTIRTESLCTAEGCGALIDVAFNVPDYIEHHRPTHARGIRELEFGWLSLDGLEERFRIPTVSDLCDVLASERATMVERCVQPPNPSTAATRKVDRVLEALAPRLDDRLTGSCPQCSRTVELYFDPISYVLEELRFACTGLYSQVHELARAYHWSERAILGLDRQRRSTYVAMVRGELALV